MLLNHQVFPDAPKPVAMQIPAPDSIRKVESRAEQATRRNVLLIEAETISRNAGLLELLGDVYLSRAFIFFRQKD